jgi:hypothetical protein
MQLFVLLLGMGIFDHGGLAMDAPTSILDNIYTAHGT